ncbi:MAG: hypothetical protein HKL90_08970 [Elusimicrobia bacterium]|nr:hypothetical protein [Elusimicrobiota bacterium]
MSRRGGAGLLALGLTLAGAWQWTLRAQGRGVPLITDEGEYSVAARVWAEGGLPYRDAFSQKPPLVLLAYRAARAVSSDPEAPRALGALAALATLGALFFCAPASWSAAGRLAAPAAFAALSALPIGDYGFTANTEVFVNFFAALSAAAVLRGAPLAAGLAAGAALSAKQTALWTVLGFGALSAWTPRGFSPRRAARFALGAAAAPAAFAVYFAARGAFHDYWACVWSGNARYTAVMLESGAFSAQLTWFTRALLPRLVGYGLPALALAGWSLHGRRAGHERPVETLAVVWFGTAIAGALTGLFFFPHYFVTVAPALALGAAAGVERLGRARARWAGALILALWPALLAPRLLFASSARERALSLLYPNPLFETQLLGAEIARRAAPGDRLHVFGSEGALFVYSGLRPATPHTLSYALTLFPKDGALGREEMARLSAAPPRFIVWSGQPLSTMIASRAGADYRDALRAFVAAGYDYAGSVRVLPSLQPPAFEPASSAVAAPFGDEDRLMLFVRRAP